MYFAASRTSTTGKIYKNRRTLVEKTILAFVALLFLLLAAPPAGSQPHPQDLVLAISDLRSRLGVDTVEHSPGLSLLAKRYAERLAETRNWSHDEASHREKLQWINEIERSGIEVPSASLWELYLIEPGHNIAPSAVKWFLTSETHRHKITQRYLQYAGAYALEVPNATIVVVYLTEL